MNFEGNEGPPLCEFVGGGGTFSFLMKCGRKINILLPQTSQVDRPECLARVAVYDCIVSRVSGGGLDSISNMYKLLVQK